jgi:hypothetical protein
MKTRTQILNGKTYRFFFDRYIKSWTVYEIDGNGFQVSEADHFGNKEDMLRMYNFDFK